MLRTLIIFACVFMLTSASLLEHPCRVHRIKRPDFHFKRNCFFSPAQCILENFPKSSNLIPMLSIFEDKSLTTIYSKMTRSNNMPFFFRLQEIGH
ncbi:uncharacterized protein CELE_K02A6.1 [Caenorhabditis elegans]|uniref:Secreted protein n=1 Tax=Caenorhabditis elegans TaxID=6239 RepID=Q21110_CAEEL|nr:Secreted protein [Caenorhabditis elegans]CCD67570.1 Secreted protein [Caenorhabditis elegans]|eukprot:NP_509386.1 Uncharacterized protein CELE_K02A6.1 [Caenorhabditis elegans]